MGKFALIQHQRYAHAKQFKRANRTLKKLRIYLGRVIRDIGRKIEGDSGLEAAFAQLLMLARRCASNSSASAGPRSIPCTRRKSNASAKARPQALRVRRQVSVATTISHAKGGQFVAHVKALPGNPYDGHTLATVIPDIEALVGNIIAPLLADKGYRGHNAPPDYKFRIFLSSQKRGSDTQTQAQTAPQPAIEPVIGQYKAEHRVGRNYLGQRRGDTANAVLAAVGYNSRRLIRWLSLLLRLVLQRSSWRHFSLRPAESTFFTDD